MNDIRHDFAPPPPVLRQWWFIGAILVTIVALMTIIVALMTGARPGGWLDVALNASGCLGVLEEHESPVQSVAFSPDGALLASGSQDGTARVWRVADGRISGYTLLHTLKISTGGREAGYSHDVTFSPDGKTLAFGLPDGTVRLWRLSGDKQHPQATLLHTLRVEAGKICSLGFSPDGRTLVAGTWNGSVHLWRVTDGTHLRSLKGHDIGLRFPGRHHKVVGQLERHTDPRTGRTIRHDRCRFLPGWIYARHRDERWRSTTLERG